MLSKNEIEILIAHIEAKRDGAAPGAAISLALLPDEIIAVLLGLGHMVEMLETLPENETAFIASSAESAANFEAPTTLASFLAEAIGAARTWSAEEARIVIDVTATFARSAPEGE